ncbi:MAG: sulfatase-like hydrolase/transferase, partial [Henriciella sp.]|nr:sulfatase-like hydrolase/transferase [Henriciella sp.]
RVLDNTLIVYVNDNGWEQAGDVEYADNHITLANGGPRGKGSFFETGFRTPIIFYWQGKITALRDTETFASAIDIMPTILDYIGVETPDGLPGYSLKPTIDGAAQEGAREFFVGRMTQHRAGTDFRGKPSNNTDDHMGAALRGYYRRDHDWHFVWLPQSEETALYDLNQDPGQLTDVAAANIDKVEAFKADIQAWRDVYETPAP